VSARRSFSCTVLCMCTRAEGHARPRRLLRPVGLYTPPSPTIHVRSRGKVRAPERERQKSPDKMRPSAASADTLCLRRGPRSARSVRPRPAVPRPARVRYVQAPDGRETGPRSGAVPQGGARSEAQLPAESPGASATTVPCPSAATHGGVCRRPCRWFVSRQVLPARLQLQRAGARHQPRDGSVHRTNAACCRRRNAPARLPLSARRVTSRSQPARSAPGAERAAAQAPHGPNGQGHRPPPSRTRGGAR
jgi:hypothetical protein